MAKTDRPILIVDDEEMTLRVLKTALAEEGFETLSTREPERAVPMVLQHRPCVVLLDLNMPGMDGLQVLDRIRKASSTPVIMLTGMDSAEKAVAAMKLGAFEYLTRPIDFPKLLKTIQVARSSKEEPEQRLKIGRYRLLGELGRGRMAVVYEAVDEVLERPTAVKVLLPELVVDPHLEERLLREARAAARLNHRSIVTIYEAGRDRGRIFLAMELVQGNPLKTWQSEGIRFSHAHAAHLAKNVAEGLGVAHKEGLIHRDVNPSNLMLASNGAVKILDFGLVQDHPAGGETTLSMDAKLRAAPYYASPEQLEGKPFDARSDVYAFGVVLYEVLAGARAFPEGNVFQVALDVTRGNVARPLSQIPGVPASLASLVEKMMQTDPENRPSSMDEVLKELDGALADAGIDLEKTPVTAWPDLK